MLLYKYFPPERIDVLCNLKIRFSQPAIYNDPFELRPITTSSITEEQFNNIMPILIKFHGGLDEQVNKIREITYSNFLMDQRVVIELIQQVMASGSLALCLTEVSESLLMWAHYGLFHKGFVVGFDAQHEFFTCPQGGYFPRRVTYQVLRPTVTIPNPNQVETYFTKSLEWAYEREWRLFRLPPSGNLSAPLLKDYEGFPIYLFDLPSNAIKEIILGCRAELNLQQSVRCLVNNIPGVVTKKAELSKDKYELKFITI